MPIFTRVFPFWGKGIIGTFYFLPASTCEYRTSKSSSPTQGNIYGFFLKAYDYFHLRSGLRQNNNTLFKPPWDLKEGVDGFAFKGCTHDCYECIRFLLKAPEMRPLSRVHGQFPRRGNNYDQNLRFDGLPTVRITLSHLETQIISISIQQRDFVAWRQSNHWLTSYVPITVSFFFFLVLLLMSFHTKLAQSRLYRDAKWRLSIHPLTPSLVSRYFSPIT